jgi:GntR family transcriptional regulator/MocR family aminotransferase
LDPLATLDDAGRVIYVGSFSKVLLPTLRLGFAVAPPSLVGALAKAKHVADWHTSVPLQGAAAAFLDDGLLVQHVRRMRRVYAERHDAVLDALQRHGDGRVVPLPSNGGLHLTALLPGRRGAADLGVVDSALRAGVAVLPLSYHYVSSPPRSGLLLGYGTIEAHEIPGALRRLLNLL